jgi:hypothetical protein
MSVPERSTKASVARLRAKNQMTVPEVAVAGVGAAIGDRFLVTVEDGVIRLEPVRASYAGSLRDVFPDDWEAELRADRDAWRA